jgi:hypothetical protein
LSHQKPKALSRQQHDSAKKENPKSLPALLGLESRAKIFAPSSRGGVFSLDSPLYRTTLIKVPSKDTAAVVAALTRHVRKLPAALRCSLTWDRGLEMAQHKTFIGTPTRFARGKQIGTYVGMIPCEESSARKQRLGHISKQGSSLLRFLLVEAAQAAARSHPDWRRRYFHLAMRRHKSIAKVAMGRRLAVRLYWMWRNGCAYSPSLEFGSYVGQLGTGRGLK